MNVWKKIQTIAIFAFGFLLIASLDGFAQRGQRGARGEGNQMNSEQRIERQLQHLTEQLSLTEEQQAQIKTLLQKQAKDMKALRENTDLEQEQQRTQFRKIFNDTNTKIRALLNSEQQTAYDKMQTQMRQRRRQNQANSEESADKTGDATAESEK